MYTLPTSVISFVNTVTLVLSPATVKMPAGGLGETDVDPAGTVQQELSPVQSPESETTRELAPTS